MGMEITKLDQPNFTYQLITFIKTNTINQDLVKVHMHTSLGRSNNVKNDKVLDQRFQRSYHSLFQISNSRGTRKKRYADDTRRKKSKHCMFNNSILT